MANPDVRAEYLAVKRAPALAAGAATTPTAKEPWFLDAYRGLGVGRRDGLAP